MMPGIRKMVMGGDSEPRENLKTGCFQAGSIVCNRKQLGGSFIVENRCFQDMASLNMEILDD